MGRPTDPHAAMFPERGAHRSTVYFVGGPTTGVPVCESSDHVRHAVALRALADPDDRMPHWIPLIPARSPGRASLLVLANAITAVLEHGE